MQSADGQWVFMDPLNVRVLLAHYGTYDACPSTITARVVELEVVEQVMQEYGIYLYVSYGCVLVCPCYTSAMARHRHTHMVSHA